MKYFKFARNQCCNYGNGPNKKVHFCWLEPGGDNLCLLYNDDNAHCDWFINAVLPWDKNLLRQWQDELKGYPTNLKQCAGSCGKKFLPTSNRQSYCPDCGKVNRKSLVAKAVRKHKANGVVG